jgi:hypothetical protein
MCELCVGVEIGGGRVDVVITFFFSFWYSSFVFCMLGRRRPFFLFLCGTFSCVER